MPKTKTTNLPQEINDIETLVQQAIKGNEAVMPQIRQWFDDHPNAWRFAGDLSLRVQEKLLTMMTGSDALMREGISRVMHSMTQELTGEYPSPLEQLLARRIALDWCYLHYVERLEAQGMEQKRSRQEAAYSAKRVDRAHRRYMHAIKMLATVQRLLTPAVLMQFGMHAHKHMHIAQKNEK